MIVIAIDKPDEKERYLSRLTNNESPDLAGKKSRIAENQQGNFYRIMIGDSISCW